MTEAVIMHQNHLIIVIILSPLGSRSVPWLGEGLSTTPPSWTVLCCPLPDRVSPVFVQVFYEMVNINLVDMRIHMCDIDKCACAKYSTVVYVWLTGSTRAQEMMPDARSRCRTLHIRNSHFLQCHVKLYSHLLT